MQSTAGILPRLTCSVAEAAEALGTSPYLVRQLVARGDVLAVRAGDRLLINVTSLEEYAATPTDDLPRSDTDYQRKPRATA